MEFQEAILKYAEEPITKQVIRDLLKYYNRPFVKVIELVIQGLLTQIKKGL
jgi:hypothetical protein